VRQETVDYFTNPPRNHKISEIVRRGKMLYRLNESHIYSSMERVYDMIQAGYYIRDLDLVWTVWRDAITGPESLYFYREKKRDYCEKQVDDISRAAISTQHELAKYRDSLSEQAYNRFCLALGVVGINIIILTIYLLERYVQ